MEYINTLLQKFIQGFTGYFGYLIDEVTFNYNYKPWWENYFYGLILLSIIFMLLEWARPWRVEQPRFRKDFWLDAFYMFFNFFIFSLIIYNAASSVVVSLFNDVILAVTAFDLQQSNPMAQWPHWAILLTGFVVSDFLQWWIHRLLHFSPRLWEFHKVHHSVEQMGFAAHLRYHWMETIVYKSIQYIPLALLGIGLYDFFIIHIFTIMVGHFNHTNITVSGWVKGAVFGALIGLLFVTQSLDLNWMADWPLWQKAVAWLGFVAAGAGLVGPISGYLFNSPEMHIWHHAHDMPEDKPYGINFGITLAIWDYIFGTAHMPHSGRDIRLGFPGMEKFPKDFLGLSLYGIKKREEIGDRS